MAQGPSGWHIKTKLEVKKGEKEFYILSRMERNRKNLSHLAHQCGLGCRRVQTSLKFNFKLRSTLKLKESKCKVLRKVLGMFGSVA